MNIILEDEHIIALSKPAGTSFHSESGAGFFEEVKSAIKADTLFPVHRLDKLTSGVIVFAKTKAAAQALGDAFEKHNIEKYYLAISDKKPKKKQGCIKGDIHKARGGSYKLSPSNNNPAITQFFSYSIGDGKRLYLLKPKTGKTHQLRVMMKSIGAPILGDVRYNGGESDRGYLHAFQISFLLFDKTYLIQDCHSISNWPINDVSKEIESPQLLSWPKI